MPNELVLSIDAMGGDHAPDIVLDGVERAARKHQGVRFILHGAETQVQDLLRTRAAARQASRIVAAERAIAMDVKPSQALRQGKGSSLWNAVGSVADGEAHAVVSAGNTGAYMAIAMFRLRTMAGVHRPALAAMWPSMRGGKVAVLDVGANVQADAEQLVDFAIIGEAYHRAITGAAHPTVGLLNVGSEEQKGHEEIRAAARLIRESAVKLAFHGFVEGDDIAKGTVDVIVTDGFTGNIALKTAEGTARLVAGFLREALSSNLMSRIGALIAYPALRKLRDQMDPRNVNGAVFLGLNGLVVKSHGGTDGPGFAAAIDVAVQLARSEFRDEIARNIARLADSAAADASGQAAQ
ncbi:MAG: phosphate acyltransferase PlsX [Alphaproteobacteria bacterium]|nr:phosphate acyltransferase PlsX [Alphaproteobacteria bacterium]